MSRTPRAPSRRPHLRVICDIPASRFSRSVIDARWFCCALLFAVSCTDPVPYEPGPFRLVSPEFKSGSELATDYTCRGHGISPMMS